MPTTEIERLLTEALRRLTERYETGTPPHDAHVTELRLRYRTDGQRAGDRMGGTRRRGPRTLPPQPSGPAPKSRFGGVSDDEGSDDDTPQAQ